MTLLFRNIVVCYLCTFLVQSPDTLFGLDMKYCYIRDKVKHEVNQKLLKVVLDEEIAKLDSTMTSVDQANYLSARITKIGNTLLKQGFLADAYDIPNIDQNSMISFNSFALWEGEKNTKGSIPLTFFIYIWPSKKLALKHNSTNPLNIYYSSNIHCHPIPCSFAVLQGTLIQKNYECTGSDPMLKFARLINEELFRKGEGDVDDLTKPHIHQLYNNGHDSKISLSLHSYGLSSSEKVMACFRKTFSECSYNDSNLN